VKTPPMLKTRFLFSIVLFLLNFSAFAAKDSVLKHVDLDELVFRSGKPKSKKYKVRFDNVTQHILPADQGGYRDTFGYLTRFPALERRAVTIYEVECRIDEYDTSEMSMFLIFVQIHEGDTTIRRVSLDHDVIRHNKTTHYFTSADAIAVEPGEFYLGYAYFTRAHKTIELRQYCTERREREGATLKLRKGIVGFFPADNFWIIFPFGVRYY
jgi:hypothetical protein